MVSATNRADVSLFETAATLRTMLSTFDPGRFSASDCATLADHLASTAKACQAASLLSAARAAELGVHRHLGFADPATWIASSTGTTTRQAKESLKTARSLKACPGTKDALLSGDVSLSQAEEIAKAEHDAPGSEGELLAVARNGDLTQLRDKVRERTLSQSDPHALHPRQVAARRFRHWRDGLGMVCFDGALPPETGLPLVTRIERLARRRIRVPDGGVGPERFEARAADALVELTAGRAAKAESDGDPAGADDGTAPKRRVPTELVLVCDVHAWRRGHAHEGEPCHIVGGGPIPVPVAKELAEDAFVKCVLHDGVAIQYVSHPGRRLSAALKTAIDLGPVPAFSGRACVDCGRTYGLENDHVDPVANTGPSSYANVKPRCYPHHAQKTERDRRAGLLAGRAKARAHAVDPDGEDRLSATRRPPVKPPP